MKLAEALSIFLIVSACGPASTTSAPVDTAKSTIAPASSPAEATASPQPKLWRAAAAPAGAPTGTEWIAIDTFDGKTVLAAVIQPAGAGPWPVAIFLHGSGGMQPRELELAAWLAREGFLTVVPCWANLGGVRPVNLGCVADARLVASESAMLKDIRTYSEAARTLPNARADRLVLMGHSLGAWAAVLAASTGVPVDAVVSISGTYNGEQRALSELGVLIKENLDGLRSPLLIVHGTKDDVWVIGPAREYEQLALTRGKKVEALYVEGAPHGLPYRPEFWTDEVRGRVIAFLRK